MKAEIEDGILTIIPQNKTEDYALDCWFEKNVNPCTGLTIDHTLNYEGYFQQSVFRRLKVKFWLWYYNTKSRCKNKFSFVFK